MSLEILYQDERFIAVYKPPGLLVHRTSIDAGESRFCVQMLRDQLGREVFPCHRLDKPAAGILLFALSREALRTSQAAFAAGLVAKRYLAVVRGWISEAGEIDYPLLYERDDCDRRGAGGIQEARTHFRRIATTELPFNAGRYTSARYSLVELSPITGRKHQLRRHMAHIRHPIVGDTRHGDGAQNRFFREHLSSHRLMLVATKLAFRPESDLREIVVESSPDADFVRTVEAAGLL